ncbi:MAG: fimbrial chaperone protein [Myxococcota bacterium]|jgi:fimbrial chaperone protein
MTHARNTLLVWATCALLSFPILAGAFTLTPISQVLAPSGSGASGSYEVVNSSSEPIAVEFFVAHLLKHPDGSEDLSQREDDAFAVFPPQAVLAPGASRTVRVRWLGDPEPVRELAFRFMAEQIPVVLHEPEVIDDGKARGGVNIYYRIHGTLFVRPRGAEPQIDVQEIELVEGTDGPEIRIRLENTGHMRGWVRQFKLHVVVGDETYTLTQADVPALENLPVLAGGIRELVAPWPGSVPAHQPSAASLSLLD